jgi:membrane protein YqaA with SNARE-associated domain
VPNSSFPAFWFYILIFLEGWIFPIPPDPFYIPQLLTYPKKMWDLALQCTIISVLGGCVAYYLGFTFHDTFGQTLIVQSGYAETFATVAETMHRWGGVLIALKGFTPFPYKIIALVAGMTHLHWTTFVVSSLIARSIRFYAVAFLTYRYGVYVTPVLKKYKFWLNVIWGVLLMGGGMWIGCVFFRLMKAFY